MSDIAASDGPWRHEVAVIDGNRLHYVVAGPTDGSRGDPVLLIHGFPQTWYEWHQVIPALAEKFTVIAPDFRGAGHSAKPLGGYDKHTMMEDLRGIVKSLGFSKLRVVGHDVGAMIAYRYAAVHPDEVEKLVLMDAPVPGTKQFAAVRAHPRAWHINFHSARDISEFLVAGKEREYLRFFFESRVTNPAAFPLEAMEPYLRAYAAPGGLRAGFEWYRNMERDGEENQTYLAKKLKMPVLVIGGEVSVSGPFLADMLSDIAEDGRLVMVQHSGHWLCEENPAGVNRALLNFL